MADFLEFKAELELEMGWNEISQISTDDASIQP